VPGARGGGGGEGRGRARGAGGALWQGACGDVPGWPGPAPQLLEHTPVRWQRAPPRGVEGGQLDVVVQLRPAAGWRGWAHGSRAPARRGGAGTRLAVARRGRAAGGGAGRCGGALTRRLGIARHSASRSGSVVIARAAAAGAGPARGLPLPPLSAAATPPPPLPPRPPPVRSAAVGAGPSPCGTARGGGARRSSGCACAGGGGGGAAVVRRAPCRRAQAGPAARPRRPGGAAHGAAARWRPASGALGTGRPAIGFCECAGGGRWAGRERDAGGSPPFEMPSPLALRPPPATRWAQSECAVPFNTPTPPPSPPDRRPSRARPRPQAARRPRAGRGLGAPGKAVRRARGPAVCSGGGGATAAPAPLSQRLNRSPGPRGDRRPLLRRRRRRAAGGRGAMRMTVRCGGAVRAGGVRGRGARARRRAAPAAERAAPAARRRLPAGGAAASAALLRRKQYALRAGGRSRR
jgi:hypothetical protein